MRALRRLFLFVFVVLLVVVTTVIVTRVSDGQEVGPPATICPGPDEFGYVCEAGGAAYIDATNDTHLYQDDDLVALDLPFTFSFYGTQYDALLASSNGNLQFSTENSAYANECLAPRPVAGMGDLIAPYWDDLDLSFRGFLQTEVVGETPERIFVVEWDGVPRFSSRDDLLTFEVQLFESSNDIVFLYRDARTLEGASGSQATIGIQSENQGYALQVSCDQHAVDDGNMIRFPYPGEPPADAGLSYVPRPSLTEARRPALEKGQGAAVVVVLNTRGRQALTGQRASWLNQRPRLESEWLWADVDGDDRQEMVILWRGLEARPELVELALLGRDEADRWQLLWQERPLARQERYRSLVLAAAGDLTGDGSQEIVLSDPASGALLVLMTGQDGPGLIDVPGRCNGAIVLRDTDDDGLMEIVRAGCPGGGRWSLHWDGQEFSAHVRR